MQLDYFWTQVIHLSLRIQTCCLVDGEFQFFRLLISQLSAQLLHPRAIVARLHDVTGHVSCKGCSLQRSSRTLLQLVGGSFLGNLDIRMVIKAGPFRSLALLIHEAQLDLLLSDDGAGLLLSCLRSGFLEPCNVCFLGHITRFDLCLHLGARPLVHNVLKSGDIALIKPPMETHEMQVEDYHDYIHANLDV